MVQACINRLLVAAASALLSRASRQAVTDGVDGTRIATRCWLAALLLLSVSLSLALSLDSLVHGTSLLLPAWPGSKLLYLKAVLVSVRVA
jgi:hypothetical protein